MRELDNPARHMEGILQRDFERDFKRAFLGTMTDTVAAPSKPITVEALEAAIAALPPPGPIYIEVGDDIVYKTRFVPGEFEDDFWSLKSEAFATGDPPLPPAIWCRDQAAMDRFLQEARRRCASVQRSYGEGIPWTIDGVHVCLADTLTWKRLQAEMEAV